MSKLLCDREARDNAGKLPRHYIDSDKFEPEEIAYMKRIIGKKRNLTISSNFNHNNSVIENNRTEKIHF